MLLEARSVRYPSPRTEALTLTGAAESGISKYEPFAGGFADPFADNVNVPSKGMSVTLSLDVENKILPAGKSVTSPMNSDLLRHSMSLPLPTVRAQRLGVFCREVTAETESFGVCDVCPSCYLCVLRCPWKNPRV